MRVWLVSEVLWESAGEHEHVVGVRTVGGYHSSNAEVVRSIEAGDSWLTCVLREPRARIRPLPRCPRAGCTLTPYLTTSPGDTERNRLESLPRVQAGRPGEA
ncbi:MAG: hypothetical protein ACOZNI_27200 [Myxococcota bacterium]